MGEGITYLENTETLVWVDIENNKSFELCLKNKKIEEYNHNFTPSFAVKEGKSYALVSADGIFEKIKNTKKFKKLVDLNFDDNFRTNDGRKDLSGDIWFSTMDVSQKKKGNIYKLSKFPKPVFTNILIPNSICFCNKQQKGFFSDSAQKKIWSFSLEEFSPNLFYLFKKGEPDGAIVDENGNLHVAVWGEGYIAVISPDAKLIDKVATPFDYPTCLVAFNLNNKSYIAVTSARRDGDGGGIWISESMYNFNT